MKFRSIALMALAFAGFDKAAQKTIAETNSYKEAFKGTRFQNVNVGNNPIFHPSKSMQINRKRRLKRIN